MTHLKKTLALLVLLTLTTACTTYESVAISSSPEGSYIPSTDIAPGDQVRLTLRSGEEAEFEVASVEPGLIGDESTVYDLNDVSHLTVRRPDNDRTMKFMGSAVLLVALLGLADAAADSIPPGLP